MFLSYYIFVSIESCVALATICLNLIVVTAIARSPHLHTANHMFIANLALADIAVGFVAIPMTIATMSSLTIGFYHCVFLHCLAIQLTNVSTLMLVTVAVDRFFAINSPYVYHRIMTNRKAVYLNGFVWILGCLLGLVPMVWNSGNKEIDTCSFTAIIAYDFMVYFQFFGMMLLPLVTMACIYIYIVFVVRRHMNLERRICKRLRQQDKNRDKLCDEEVRFTRDVQAAKTFATVLFVYSLCWLPLNILDTVTFFCGSSCKSPFELLLASILMSHVNSSINPFLYALTNGQVRAAMKKLLGMRAVNNILNNSTAAVSTAKMTPTTNETYPFLRQSMQYLNNEAGHLVAEHSVDPITSYKAM